MSTKPIKALDRGRSVIYAAKLGIGYEQPTPDALLDLALNTVLAVEACDIDNDAAYAMLDGIRSAWIAMVEEASEESNMQDITAQEAEKYYHHWYARGFLSGIRTSVHSFDELGAWPDWLNFHSRWPKVFLREIAALTGYRDGVISRRAHKMAQEDAG